MVKKGSCAGLTKDVYFQRMCTFLSESNWTTLKRLANWNYVKCAVAANKMNLTPSVEDVAGGLQVSAVLRLAFLKCPA